MAGPPPSSHGHAQVPLNSLGVQFFSSLEGLEVVTSADRQLIRGHNLVGAVHLQFVRPAYFENHGGEHAKVLGVQSDLDIPLSMHVYPFPEIDEWDGQWFFFDVQLHPYELHFRRKVADGDESVIGSWEDVYGKLAQVRGQMCLQPFQGPIDTKTFKFKAGSISEHQLKCSGFIQCQTYLTPPRENESPFKGGRPFHILAYMPYDQQPWKSRIGWMNSSAEGGFVSRKWMYGRGSIIGVLNVALLEKEPEPGQDILVVLVDDFGFISRARFDSGGSKGNDLSPQKPRQEPGKVRNPFSSSPTGPSPRMQKARDKSVDTTAEEAIPSAVARRLFGSQQESTEPSVTVSTDAEEDEASAQVRNSLKRAASSVRDGPVRKRVSSWKVQDAREAEGRE
ncbi:unnamed protein product [Clonostachys chloroleuca]|uniref:Uncharacterized protein n=1 Tax=Clonostachys chloroleuca TaxID=1926264 RepID=A0AA35LQG4_9HYPO|nr:unnamed protein product [Clonostachys chloroleuca]